VSERQVPGLPPGADLDSPVFVISVAAELAGMHAQTLRGYDRLGLVRPGRSAGGGRRYSARDIALLREVQRLSQEEGVNLAGVKRIIDLERQVDELRAQVAELLDELAAARAAAEQAAAAVHASYRRDLVPVRRQTSITVWRPTPPSH
jgi:MerR family transcriptional regulator/heat shock protein HspR